MTKLITKDIRAQLIKNHAYIEANGDAFSLAPVVKFFTPDAAATWIIVSGVEVGNDMNLWGWCDLGVGFPEYGQVSLNELQTLRGQYGLPVERDKFFKFEGSLGDFVNGKSVV